MSGGGDDMIARAFREHQSALSSGGGDGDHAPVDLRIGALQNPFTPMDPKIGCLGGKSIIETDGVLGRRFDKDIGDLAANHLIGNDGFHGIASGATPPQAAPDTPHLESVQNVTHMKEWTMG